MGLEQRDLALGRERGRQGEVLSLHVRPSFQPAIPYALHNGAHDRESLYLAVDKKIKRIFDLDDATKVKSREGRIVDIGKTIPEYDAVDTGLFICPPGIFEALEGAQVRGDCSLSDGVRAMAERGQARTVDIGGLLAGCGYTRDA